MQTQQTKLQMEWLLFGKYPRRVCNCHIYCVTFIRSVSLLQGTTLTSEHLVSLIDRKHILNLSQFFYFWKKTPKWNPKGFQDTKALMCLTHLAY